MKIASFKAGPTTTYGLVTNTGIIDGHVDHDAGGYLITKPTMETTIPGLFAAGDVRAQLTRQVTTAVGDATTAAIAAEKYLAARKHASVGAGVAAGDGAIA